MEQVNSENLLKYRDIILAVGLYYSDDISIEELKLLLDKIKSNDYNLN